MLANSGAISSGNLAEALSKVAERGGDPSEVARDLGEGILGGLLEVEPVTAQDAITIAEMRPATKEHGLGLGDRICLALGRRLDLPVMTADRAWSSSRKSWASRCARSANETSRRGVARLTWSLAAGVALGTGSGLALPRLSGRR